MVEKVLNDRIKKFDIFDIIVIKDIFDINKIYIELSM